MQTSCSNRPDPRPLPVDRRGVPTGPAPAPQPIISALSSRRRSLGFTLIETMVATAISAVLSSIAYPSFQAQVHKARRGDALLAIQQVQMAQERWRANHAGYASLAQLGLASVSPSGHYAIDVSGVGAHAYQVGALASGTQAGDLACRSIRLGVDGANATHASGTDATSANPEAPNRACWSL